MRINGGKMDKLARRDTLADHFYHAAFGGSFLNHFFLVCACAQTRPTTWSPSSTQATISSCSDLTW
jgi:phospholipase C